MQAFPSDNQLRAAGIVTLFDATNPAWCMTLTISTDDRRWRGSAKPFKINVDSTDAQEIREWVARIARLRQHEYV